MAKKVLYPEYIRGICDIRYKIENNIMIKMRIKLKVNMG